MPPAGLGVGVGSAGVELGTSGVDPGGFCLNA